MDCNNLLTAKNRAEFRAWLMQHSAREKDCWVCVKRVRPTDEKTFWYLDAVEEALCFGWLDSTVKRLPDGRTARTFLKAGWKNFCKTPRQACCTGIGTTTDGY
ncbi:YdeI/OmpD-associated family protein [Candidatus Avelusimicrobium sp.]|uniref:YdeI/OmpD-associated family protein n=1 Tax=Candidatus Avelusimicrobium sp. TaxID=3048833 RepID=UPI003D7CC780